MWFTLNFWELFTWGKAYKREHLDLSLSPQEPVCKADIFLGKITCMFEKLYNIIELKAILELIL